ncbi:MAG: HAD family hydrolase [Alicyclobacillaceae bacterium]|nr:HAD family hydrolase [Alicyclobacillaceae bacterium]
MFKALVFDFDGTILDTETAWYTAFREVYAQYGVELTLEQYAECIGTDWRVFHPYEYLVNKLQSAINLEELRQSVAARHEELMNHVEIRAGVVPLLCEAKKRGLKLGVASSSNRAWVEKHLKQVGLLQEFECIRTSEDVARVKPSPELYEKTVACLQVSAHEAMAIEDSPNGAQAAIAAGLRCVVAPNEVTRSLTFPPALIRLRSLSDLPASALLDDSLLAGRSDLL